VLVTIIVNMKLTRNNCEGAWSYHSVRKTKHKLC